MKRYISALAIAMLLIAGVMAGVALAADTKDTTPPAPPAFGPGGPGGPGDIMKLTPDQEKKLIDLQEKLYTENDKIDDSVMTKMFEMRKLTLAENPNIKAIEKIEDDIHALNEQHYTLMKEFRKNARAILTAEQLKANPLAFVGPGGCPFGGPGGGFGMGKEHGRGMMSSFGPGGDR